MAISVREKPPLRLAYSVRTPSGSTYRWGQDEPSPSNQPSDESFSDSVPGGFDALSAVLPRKSGTDFSDLERLSTVTVQGVGGEIAGEYRLERAPRTSGDQLAISPGCVGWQAHLEDDKSAAMVYIDQELGGWTTASTQRKINLVTSGFQPEDASVSADEATGAPSLQESISDTWTATYKPHAVAQYDIGPSCNIGSLYYAWKINSNVNSALTDWGWTANVGSDDTFASLDTTGSLRAAGPGSGTLSATTTRRAAEVNFFYNAAGGADGAVFSIFWTALQVFGDHGLTKQGTAPSQGFFASDVIAHAVGRWAPQLHFSTGSEGSIKPTSFVIPQLAFKDPTTAAEIIKQANRFHLNDWAVWEGQRPAEPTFYYLPRGSGRNWRARIAPAQLQETGPQIDRLWNGVLVSFKDVSGVTRTVGPTGALADSTDATLTDTDPENPANELGIRRWALLDMGIVSTTAGATEVGRRFLEESKQLDKSGKAQLVGHVEDDKGVLHPYWKVRAGDSISFVDAADSSPRRIVRTEKSVAARTCSVDLDAPPEGLGQLLERLGVVLVGVV